MSTSAISERAPLPGYWRLAWIFALVIMATLSVRLVELLPLIPKLKPALITTFILFPIVLVHSGARARARALRNRTAVLLYAYVLWAALTVPFALWRGGAAKQVESMPFGVLVVIALLLCAPTRNVMSRIAIGFTAMAALMGGLAYVEGAEVAGRLTTAGAFDPNDLASLMAVALPFAVSYMIRGRRRVRMVAAAATLIMVMTTLATGSRGGLVGLAAGLFVLVAGMKLSRAALVIALVLAAAPLAWNWAPERIRERLGTLSTVTQLESDYNVTTDYGRIATWTRGIGYALKHPVFGVGAGNFGVAEGERLIRLNRTGPWHTAHDAYVQAFAELGFPGGIIFLLLLWTAGKTAFRLWRSERRQPQYLAGLVGFCVAAVFLSHAYAYHLYALLGIMAHAETVLALEARGGRPVGESRIKRTARFAMRV